MKNLSNFDENSIQKSRKESNIETRAHNGTGAQSMMQLKGSMADFHAGGGIKSSSFLDIPVETNLQESVMNRTQQKPSGVAWFELDRNDQNFKLRPNNINLNNSFNDISPMLRSIEHSRTGSFPQSKKLFLDGIPDKYISNK